MGLAVVSLPVLVLAMPDRMPKGLLLLSMPMLGWMVQSERHHVRPTVLAPVVAGRFLGTPPRAWIVSVRQRPHGAPARALLRRGINRPASEPWPQSERQPTRLLPLTFGGLAGLAGMLPSGHVMDVLGRRPVVRWGMAATGITATAFVLIDSVWMILPSSVRWGWPEGSSVHPPVIVADIAAPNTRGSAVAVSRMGPALGLAIGPFAAGVLSDTLGIQAAFLVSGIFLSVLAIAAVAIPETLADRGDDRKPLSPRSDKYHLKFRFYGQLCPRTTRVWWSAVPVPGKMIGEERVVDH